MRSEFPSLRWNHSYLESETFPKKYIPPIARLRHLWQLRALHLFCFRLLKLARRSENTLYVSLLFQSVDISVHLQRSGTLMACLNTTLKGTSSEFWFRFCIIRCGGVRTQTMWNILQKVRWFPLSLQHDWFTNEKICRFVFDFYYFLHYFTCHKQNWWVFFFQNSHASTRWSSVTATWRRSCRGLWESRIYVRESRKVSLYFAQAGLLWRWCRIQCGVVLCRHNIFNK